MSSHGYPASSAVRTRMPTRADGRSDYLGRLDWILLLAALALSVYGSILVWSASKADLAPRTGDLQYFLKRQLLNLVIGLVLGYLVSRVNHRLLRAYTPVLYVVSLIGLLVVLIPGVGSSIAGAKAWLALPGGFTIQPSEFAKVAIILMMAMILAEKRDAESEPRDADVLQALIVAAIPIAIVLVQNDTGTVLVMGTIVITIVAVSGARTRWLVGLLLGTVVAVLLAIQLHLLQPYQVDRLTSFIDPENASSQSAGFNTEQARIAVGGGGLLGRGLFEGPQTQGSFVPVNESDFVFTVAGEELGFVGGATVIVLLGVVLWRGIRIALRAEDLFGRLVATGVVAWFAFQAFENIGMTLGIMPVTGVTLPFVSYGGTSMFATWVGVGLLQNIRVHEADS